MTDKSDLDWLISSTIWIIRDGSGYAAIDATRSAVATGKSKSSVEYTVRHLAKERAWAAIATVVEPAKRQPKRKLPRSRHVQTR